MAKITQYPAKTVPSDNDEFVLYDPSSASTKKMTRGDLIGGAPLPANSVDTQAIADGAVGVDQISFDDVGLQYFHANSGNAITFVAPFDGIAKVTHSRNGWGHAGGLFAFSMTTPTGLTKLFNQSGVTQGHDTQAIQMIASSTFSGLKKGQSYTFAFLGTTGSAGGYVGGSPWLVEVSRLS